MHDIEQDLALLFITGIYNIHGVYCKLQAASNYNVPQHVAWLTNLPLCVSLSY